MERAMESDRRYYERRAVQEKMAAARAMTAQAQAWHIQLAEDFIRRAREQKVLTALD
jgi:hypothetical protein